MMTSTSIKQHAFYHNAITRINDHLEWLINDLYENREECGISYESCELEEDSLRRNAEHEVSYTMYLAYKNGVYVEDDRGWSNYEEYLWNPYGEDEDTIIDEDYWFDDVNYFDAMDIIE